MLEIMERFKLFYLPCHLRKAWVKYAVRSCQKNWIKSRLLHGKLDLNTLNVNNIVHSFGITTNYNHMWFRFQGLIAVSSIVLNTTKQQLKSSIPSQLKRTFLIMELFCLGSLCCGLLCWPWHVKSGLFSDSVKTIPILPVLELLVQLARNASF